MYIEFHYLIITLYSKVIRTYFHFTKVFDTTRKVTYKNLTHWYEELRQNRPDIPCILVGNKIDGKLVFVLQLSTLVHGFQVARPVQ